MRSTMVSALLTATLAAACADDTEPPPDQEAPTDGTPTTNDWPTAWSADIAWSDVGPDGARSNTWTGKVSYDWSLRAMRTDVVAPAGGEPGPPIGKSGTMLMRDGKLYFITDAQTCELASYFGAPRPDWLSASHGVRKSTASAASNERWTVDTSRLDAELAGCFNYELDGSNKRPRTFGGSASCDDWPKGSYIDYSNFKEGTVAADLFAVPSSCPQQADLDPEGTKGCVACHDPP